MNETVPLTGLALTGDQPVAQFLVVERASSRLVRLPLAGSLVVGRGDDVELRLDDASVSRRHARIDIDDAGIWVADLGSKNGVLVNGTLINGQHQLTAGDLVAIGDVSLVLRGGNRGRRARRVLERHELLVRFEQELARAIHYGRPLSVAVLTLEDRSDDALARAADGGIREIDILGRNDGGDPVVIFPELDGDAARAAAATLVEGLDGARAGVASFPATGCDVPTLLSAARAASRVRGAGAVTGEAERITTLAFGDRTVVVADPAMARLYELIGRLAAAELPVLVIGETGAGKEHAAYAVHHGSSRRHGPYLAFNCAAIPDTLIESELFGHDKGAFSGATSAKAGLFERANGGTLFLDEVGELSLPAQAKLLRVLEDGRFNRLGEAREREADVRIVAATNRELPAEVKARRFREDLYYRLASAVVMIPPLRDRPADILMLAQRFLSAARKSEPLTLSPGATLALTRHRWPGNVRELKNAMQFVAAAVPGRVVLASHLPPTIVPSEPAPVVATVEAPTEFRPLAEEIQALELKRIREALAAANGVKTHAARLIAMPERTFRLKLRQYQIESGDSG